MVTFGTTETALDYVVRVLDDNKEDAMHVLEIELNDTFVVCVFTDLDSLIDNLIEEGDSNGWLHSSAFTIRREDDREEINRLLDEGVEFIKSDEFEHCSSLLESILDGEDKFFKHVIKLVVDKSGKFLIV